MRLASSCASALAARHAGCGEGVERRGRALVGAERFRGRELGLIRRAAFDRGAQRLGGDRQPRRAIVGSRGLVFYVVGKRLHRAFERRDAGRQRIEIAARHVRLRGALGRIGRGRGALGLGKRILRRRRNVIDAARESGE